MTADERKRGLRAAVQAKLDALFQQKREAVEQVTMGGNMALVIFDGWQIQLMWQIIDSLVEECRDQQAVLDEFIHDIESVGTEHVGEDWPDLLVTYNNARRVRPADKEAQ